VIRRIAAICDDEFEFSTGFARRPGATTVLSIDLSSNVLAHPDSVDGKREREVIKQFARDGVLVARTADPSASVFCYRKVPVLEGMRAIRDELNLAGVGIIVVPVTPLEDWAIQYSSMAFWHTSLSGPKAFVEAMLGSSVRESMERFYADVALMHEEPEKYPEHEWLASLPAKYGIN